MVTIRQTKSRPRKCLGPASNSSTQRATAARAACFPNSRLVADINAPHSISASRMSLAHRPRDCTRFVAVGNIFNAPINTSTFARSPSVRDAKFVNSSSTPPRRFRKSQLPDHLLATETTGNRALITAASEWGNEFSRRQEIRQVKASHANSVVSHPVIDIEAVR